jgi:hypothetical protein
MPLTAADLKDTIIANFDTAYTAAAGTGVGASGNTAAGHTTAASDTTINAADGVATTVDSVNPCTLNPDLEAVREAMANAVAAAIIDLIKSDGIEIGASSATMMDVG